MNKISSVLWKLGMQVAIQIQKVVRGWDVWFRKLKQVLSVHLLIHFPLYSEKKNPFSCSSFSIVWSEIAQGKKLKICDKTRTIFWPLMGGGSFCWTTWEQSSSDGMPAPFWLEFPPVRKGAPPTTTRTSERLLACTGGGGWGEGLQTHHSSPLAPPGVECRGLLQEGGYIRVAAIPTGANGRDGPRTQKR